MTAALLVTILAPATAAAGTVVCAGVEWRPAAGGNHAVANEVVAAIVESSVSGSVAALDGERTYKAEPRSSAPAPRRLRTGSRTASPAHVPSSAAEAGQSANGGGPTPLAAANEPPPGADAGAAERSGAGEGVGGFWLLLVAGITGALLLAGGSLRADPPFRRR